MRLLYVFVAVNTVKITCEEAVKAGNIKFFCPGSQCDYELTFPVVRHILSSVMTAEELTAMCDRISNNFLHKPDTGIRSCQVCGVNWRKDYTKRWPGHRNRVVCNTCSKNQGRTVEYCWECRREWRGGDYKCGYPDCTWEEEQLTTLRTCETKTVGEVYYCPAIRACPRCGTLIRHASGCKHMTCKCGCKFCFVCLKASQDIQWECSPYGYCPIAPRQTALPSTPSSL